jgi:FkbM family methyltransferase
LPRRRGEVRFSQQGRSYVVPNELSTRYHLLESIPKLRRLSRYVRPQDGVIVDIGAHSGLFSAFALERAPNARAICVEPLHAMAPFIRRNLAGLGRWTLVSAAISDHAGGATFHAAKSSQESSLISGTIRSPSHKTAVETMTLDELCRDLVQIDVMKIDVQGAEHLVLSGGRSTLPRVRTLLIEVSLADPEPHHVLSELEREFGTWEFVNAVHAGADLLFERET